MEQRYHQGDKVKVLVGHKIWMNEGGKIRTIDISPELVGKEAIIEYSYKERYGEDNLLPHYSIKFIHNDASISWFYEVNLELIEKYDTSTNQG